MPDEEATPDPWDALRAHLSPAPSEDGGRLRLRRPRTGRLLTFAGPLIAASIAAAALIARPTGAGEVLADDELLVETTTTSGRAETPSPSPSPSPSQQGGVIATSTGRYEIGTADDRVVLGDWDCDGEDTPAMLVPASGDIYAYASWADDRRTVEGRHVRTVAGAVDVVTVHGDADGCDELEVRRADGSAVVVEVPS